MLKDLLLHARKDKLFAKLPLADKSSMSVEHQDGAHGWPAYEKRYEDGWVK
jgi:hypothetical protein